MDATFVGAASSFEDGILVKLLGIESLETY